ncbi:Cuticle protein 6 [Armadillidium vulgare]|nr:Cuticle protein 6 [Armadillidium vulgare]
MVLRFVSNELGYLRLHSLVLAVSILLSVGIGRSSLAQGGVIYAAAPAERGAFHVGGKGVYNYGYNTGDGIAKVEVRHPDGTVTGSYRYFDPLGRQIVRSYIADKRGFRVLGNELPVAPDTPAIGFPEAQTITDNIRYDFPAGFAYHAIPQRVFLKPIGVTGTHGKVALTAGHTSARHSKLPVVSPSSDILSYYRNKVYRRPYIIGHAK